MQFYTTFIMDPILKKSYEAACKGQSYAFATVVESTLKGTPRKAGAKMVVLEDGSLFGTIGGGRNEKAAREECLKALKTGQPFIVTYDYFGKEGQSVCGGQIKVFIEPFIGQKHFIICGAGHIALPLSVLGKILHYKVTLIDDRKEFANKKRFPHVDQVRLGPHAEELAKVPMDGNTFIMIVTQGNEYDYQCLKVALKTEAGYIGCISSHAKRIKFFKRLKAEGFPEKLLNKVQIPAGFDIGAQTPEEIAVSIISEIIAINNKIRLGSAKFREKEKANLHTSANNTPKTTHAVA